MLTSDLFYPHEVLGSDLEMWQRTGVVAVEMEVAALLVTAALHGAAAGAILAVDGNPLAEARRRHVGLRPPSRRGRRGRRPDGRDRSRRGGGDDAATG